MANSVFLFLGQISVNQIGFADGSYFQSYAPGKIQLVSPVAAASPGTPVLRLVQANGSTIGPGIRFEGATTLGIVTGDETAYASVKLLNISFGSPGSGFILCSSDGVFEFTNAAVNDFGRLQFGGTTNAFPAIKRSSATLAFRLADDSADASFSAANAVLSGKATTYNNQSTAGLGLAYIVSSPTALTGQTGAVTNHINYTPAAAVGTYRITGVVNVTAWTTPATFTVAVTYKDASGNARTDTALVIRGSSGASAAAITAIDRWYFEFAGIDIDNSATAITLSTTGTFTGSPVYNLSATLERIK